MAKKLIVIKVGSNVVTRTDGSLNDEAMHAICHQIASLSREDHDIILVSSGAVAAGREAFPQIKSEQAITRRQVWSAMGQIALMTEYQRLFQNQGIMIAQLLATRNDFTGRDRYLNIRNCLNSLLDEGVLPVVNENDTVSIEELMFTDNDELAGRIASMLGADELIILTSVDGLMTGDPDDPNTKLIPTIDPDDQEVSQYIRSTKSSSGRGGMSSKINAAIKAANTGTSCWLANGARPNIIIDILNGNAIGTHIKPSSDVSQPQKWLAFEFPGESGIVINQGAQAALMDSDKANSLLPIGVVSIDGDFEKGDVVRILNIEGEMIGYGVAAVSDQEARLSVGIKGQKALIHYDYMYLEDGNNRN